MTATAARGERHRALFQPLLLTGGALAILPLVAFERRVVLLPATLVLAGVGVLAWLWGSRPGVTAAQREGVAGLLFALALLGLFGVLAVVAPHRPESFLPLAAAIVAAIAAVERGWARMLVQVAVVLAASIALAMADRSLPDLLLPLVLLLSVGMLADALAGRLLTARHAEARARRDAVRREELLSGVRDLPREGLAEAAAAANRTMRGLGFDSAGVAVLQPDGRMAHFLDGIPPTVSPQRRGEGLAGRALEEDRTLVVGDYQSHPDRLADRAMVGSAVVAPIRIGGRPVAALMGARRAATEPDPEEVEVAEVLASHLGMVLDTDAQLRRQRELVARMSRLEGMRSLFVTEVSDELRHPLTVVRGIGQTLAAHDAEIPPERREDLLRRMTTQTDKLRATIDTLLDLSGFQATRAEPQLRPVSVSELVSPLTTGGTGIDTGSVGDEVVDVDADLVRHALELLLGGDGGAGAVVLRALDADGRVVLELDGPTPSDPARPGIERSLAVQLLVLGGARPDDGLRTIELTRARLAS
jgi:K+-sensing histidine kinase KdpD